MASRYYKENKYHNQPVTIDGLHFDSKGEARRYAFLQMMERAGKITLLEHHTKFELIPAVTVDEVVHLKTKDKWVTKTVQPAKYYEADFTYKIVSTGENIVEDFKGQQTDLFKFKAALFFYRYGKHIKLVKNPNEWVE